jgi:hypothetical protein
MELVVTATGQLAASAQQGIPRTMAQMIMWWILVQGLAGSGFVAKAVR